MASVFGNYELDDQLSQLCRNSLPVEIKPKVFDVRAYLLHHRDRVVAKDELLEKLWPKRSATRHRGSAAAPNAPR